MPATNILVIPDLTLQPLDEAELEAIREAAGADANVTQTDDLNEIQACLDGTTVLFGQLDEEMFAQMPALEWLHLSSSGVDHLLFPEFVESEVLLTSEKGLVGPHLADHAMGLLLAVTRRIGVAVRDGVESWNKRVEYRMAEIELQGLNLCIVGFGGTGRCIARRAAGFDMNIRAVDLHPGDGTDAVTQVEAMSALPSQLSEADVVAVCLPLTPDTEEMFNDELFAQTKRGAILVNVTRGEVIDHQALIRALDSGQLGGAGLDVHYREPLPGDDTLWHRDNVVMTPHTAGASQLRTGRNYRRFVDNVGRYRRGEPLQGEVDKRLGF